MWILLLASVALLAFVLFLRYMAKARKLTMDESKGYFFIITLLISFIDIVFIVWQSDADIGHMANQHSFVSTILVHGFVLLVLLGVGLVVLNRRQVH